MRSSRAKHGPFAERVHYALDEIDRICVEALRGAGCLPDLPARISSSTKSLTNPKKQVEAE
jgi:hypothetical protein